MAKAPTKTLPKTVPNTVDAPSGKTSKTKTGKKSAKSNPFGGKKK